MSRWPVVRLGEIVVDSCYGTSEPSSAEGTVPVVGIPHIKDGRVRLTNMSCVKLSESERTKLALEPGDILITRTNSPELVGRSGIVEFGTNAVFASYLVRLRVDTSKTDPAYLNYWLNSPLGQRQIRRITTRAVCQANVNPTELKRQLHIPLPPPDEQRRIAEVLATWDAAIEKTERLIESKNAQRAWLSRNLIDERVAADLWCRVSLGKICHAVTRKNSDGATHVLTSSARLGLVDQLEYFNKDVSGVDLSGYCLLRRGEFAYNRSTSEGYPYGAIKRLDRYEQGVLSTLYLCFTVVDQAVSSDFLVHLFHSGVMNHQLGQICQAGARSHGLLNVTKSDFFSLQVPLPDRTQQDNIVSLLGEADREIDLLRRLRGAFAAEKEAMTISLLDAQSEHRGTSLS